MDSYFRTLIEKNITSFSKIPISLPPPKNGHTWTLAWEVRDQDLVSSGQNLLTAQSDYALGEESITCSSPMPGRIHIRVNSDRYVPGNIRVGIIEYGVAFESSLVSTHREAVRKSRKLHAALVASKDGQSQAHSLREEQAAKRDETREKQREEAARNHRLKASLQRLSGAEPIRELPLLVLLQQLVFRLEVPPGGKEHPSSDALVPSLLDLFVSLNALLHPSAAADTPDRSAEALSRLYDFFENHISTNPHGVPEEILEEELMLWNQMRKQHQECFRNKRAPSPPPEGS